MAVLDGGFAESLDTPSWSIEQAIESPQSAADFFDEGMDSDFEDVEEDAADGRRSTYVMMLLFQWILRVSDAISCDA